MCYLSQAAGQGCVVQFALTFAISAAVGIAKHPMVGGPSLLIGGLSVDRRRNVACSLVAKLDRVPNDIVSGI
jgi:hypothetical protein